MKLSWKVRGAERVLGCTCVHVAMRSECVEQLPTPVVRGQHLSASGAEAHLVLSGADGGPEDRSGPGSLHYLQLPGVRGMRGCGPTDS